MFDNIQNASFYTVHANIKKLAVFSCFKRLQKGKISLKWIKTEPSQQLHVQS